MICPGTPMEWSHVNEKLRGLYLPGFPAGSRVRQTALKLIIVLRLQVIVVYGRPYLLFNLAITGQNLL